MRHNRSSDSGDQGRVSLVIRHPATALYRGWNRVAKRCTSAYKRAVVRSVAQPGSAPASGAGGRRFESSRSDHSHPSAFTVHQNSPAISIHGSSAFTGQRKALDQQPSEFRPCRSLSKYRSRHHATTAWMIVSFKTLADLSVQLVMDRTSLSRHDCEPQRPNRTQFCCHSHIFPIDARDGPASRLRDLPC